MTPRRVDGNGEPDPHVWEERDEGGDPACWAHLFDWAGESEESEAGARQESARDAQDHAPSGTDPCADGPA